MQVNTQHRTIFAPSVRPGVIVVGNDGRIVPTLPTLALVLTVEERKARLAYWIRDIRFRRGLTPPELGKLVGVTRSTVNKWENGEQVPSMLWLGPLAAALADYLVETTAASGVEEGRRRAGEPEAPDTLAPSPQRPPREAEATRGR
jgi:transcriptional regulator with XRE-family HTH domain